MKTLSLFIEPLGTVARMKTKPNDDVDSYIVFVRKWTETGALPVVTWHPDDLESETGASIEMTGATGYDFILKALVRPKALPAIGVTLEMLPPGAGAFDKPVSLPSSEGPVVDREWKVVLR